MLRVLLLLLAATVPAALSAPVRADVSMVRFAAIDGGEVVLASYVGRPVLVANTASLCGFTPQYAELQALWERYRDAGLVVIGVPTNDFGNQEPGSAAEIKTFCEVNFAVDFPLTDKVRARGVDRHPFFDAVESELGPQALPRWNFHKYLIGSDGMLAAAWPSHVRPLDAEITGAIETALAAARPNG